MRIWSVLLRVILLRSEVLRRVSDIEGQFWLRPAATEDGKRGKVRVGEGRRKESTFEVEKKAATFRAWAPPSNSTETLFFRC